jgi:hypothetical protein
MKTRIQLLAAVLILYSQGMGQYYNLSNDTGKHSKPQVAVDGVGNVHFVWVDNTTGKSEIHYAVYGSRTPGHPMIKLGSISGTSDSCSYPRIAVDSSGKVIYVVWEDNSASGKSAVICASFANPILLTDPAIVRDTLSVETGDFSYQPDISMVGGVPFVCWATDNGSGRLPFNGKLWFIRRDTASGSWSAPIFVADSIAMDCFGYGNFWGRVTSAFNGTVLWEDGQGMNAHKNLMVVGPLQNRVVSGGWLPYMKGMEIAHHGPAGDERIYVVYHGDGVICIGDEPLEYAVFDGNSWSDNSLIVGSPSEIVAWDGFSISAISDSNVVVIYSKLEAGHDTLYTIRYDGRQWNNVDLLPRVDGFSEPSIATGPDGNFWMAFVGNSDNGGTDVFVYGYPETITSVREPLQKTSPTGFHLAQNYPNPFNPSTRINYQLSANSYVTIKVYDVLGREVKTLVDEEEAAGEHTVIWDGTNRDGRQVVSGIYYCRLLTPNGSIIRKAVLIR